MRAFGWGPPAVRNWSELVEHGIRLALAISVLINIPVTMMVGSHFLDLGDPRTAAGVGCMAAATVVVGVALIYWRWRALAAVITGALAILGLLLAGPATLQVPGLADAWWPTQFLIAVMAFLTLAHPVGYALSVLLIVANALVRWDISQASSDANGLSRSTEMLASTGQLLTLVAVPAIAGFLVRGAARDVDLATQWRITARAESERAASARRQIQEADRFVHDEVLFTLRAIAMGGQGVEPAAAQDAAAALLDRIAGSMPNNPAGSSVAEGTLLGPVIARAPVRVDVRGPVAIPVPRSVLNAVRLATQEALRNVHLHARVDQAEVVTTVRGLELNVEIRDRGLGFETALTHRRGVSTSITERMADVGGSAMVESVPGAGTVVTLRWSPMRPAERLDGHRAGLTADFFPYLVFMAAPLLALGIWFPPLLARHVEQSGVIAAFSVLLTIAGLSYLGYGLTRAVSARATWGLMIVAWSAVAANGLALPPGPAHPRLFWLPGVASATVALIALYRPRREAVIATTGIIALAVVTSTLRLDPGMPWSPYAAPVATSFLVLAVSLVVREIGERMSWQILHSEREAAEHDDDSAFEIRVTERLAGRRVRLGRLLEGAASAPVQDAELRRIAIRLEEEIREHLMFGADPRPEEAVALARGAGWEVRVRVASGIPEQVSGALADAITIIARSTVATARAGTLDVTAMGTPSGTWRLSLLLRPDPGADTLSQLLALGGWQLTGSGGDVQLRQKIAPSSSNGATDTLSTDAGAWTV